MVISDENCFPILIDSIYVPTPIDNFWVLNLLQRDFMLSPLTMFEEHTTPILVVDILGYTLEIPTDWNILIYSEETSQLDMLEISEATRGIFTAVVYNHKKHKIIPGNISVIDYKSEAKIQTVSLHKNTMLCNPLGPDYWICIAPSDNYNKYLRDAVIGDII